MAYFFKNKFGKVKVSSPNFGKWLTFFEIKSMLTSHGITFTTTTIASSNNNLYHKQERNRKIEHH